MVLDLKLKLSIWVGTFGVLLNVKSSRWNVTLNECGRYLFRKFKEILEFSKTVKPIVNRDVDGSEWFHWIVANTKQFKHYVNLFNCDVGVIVEVKQTDGHNDDDG